MKNLTKNPSPTLISWRRFLSVMLTVVFMVTTSTLAQPSISATNPVNLATGVALNQKISATFNVPMDASTITVATFTLKIGIAAVSGFVSYSGTTAIFTPASNLTANAVYTATITTGSKDMSGNALANNHVWSFTTGSSVVVTSPPMVDLGTAGDFVLLAKTGISTTGTTQVNGNLGISPAAASFITGFGLIADATNTFSSSSLVTGKIYAADYTDPTPAKLITAIGDMETAYTNAAGRVSPDFTELYTGDLTGKTLTRGLYKWSTGVIVSAGGVTISGTASDVWIFQIAQNLNVANAAIVTLSGGALASNVFWQVAGQVTIGTTAAMQGIILCKTQIAMSTGASLNNGRALAQTAITLDANAITAPIVTSVEKDFAPQTFALFQNYPNPFNPSTSIQYTLEKAAQVSLKVFNVLGNEVATLVNIRQEVGSYTVPFNTNQVSVGLSSGVYFYRLEAGSFVATKKLILMK
ncbi:MAG: ice-binding family protein [Ignavibacteriaceae bacterium]|jgi:hypothetical protein